MKIMKLWLISLVVILLSACGNSMTPVAVITPIPIPVELETLTVYNWAEYIDPQIVTDFEQKFKVKVNYVTLEDSGTELMNNVKTSSGFYDVIIATDFMVMTLRREKLLMALDKANIPNIKNIDPFFINPEYDPNNRFCLPYQWGTTAIGYNRKATGRDITSWGDLFDPQFKGKVSMMDTQREVLGSVLLYLGYSPNTTNVTDIHQARDFLIKQKQQILTYKAYDGYKWLSTGKVAIAMEYNGGVMRTMLKDSNVQYIIPNEGAIMWTDNMCIPATSKHKELAETFINYILEPEVGARLSNYVLYASPNLASQPFINEAYRNSPIMYPSAETRRRLYYLVDVGPEATKLYDEAWQAILTAHEKK